MVKKALVIIDVQTAVVEESYKRDKVIDNINHLIHRARGQQIPIIYIQHESPEGPMKKGEPGWQLHPRLEKPIHQEMTISKIVPNSFSHTPLKQTLDKQGITQLYICGAQTEYCVDSTCRGAFDLDYDVTLITDAHTTNDAIHLSAPRIIEHVHETLKNFGSPSAEIRLEKSTELDWMQSEIHPQ
ncbi:cysteine hydrolase [Peribacillus muralis]|uniref:cysteine hydrolase family protein n=1 Tax=Peribacillus muralis TaxID=264697 RepID=UPI001F4DD83C|nr:cysteine hydrolase [Peribacillus muralis]MCK2013787.1 cysteine hydrolase [Peribacillus muralis]